MHQGLRKKTGQTKETVGNNNKPAGAPATPTTTTTTTSKRIGSILLKQFPPSIVQFYSSIISTDNMLGTGGKGLSSRSVSTFSMAITTSMPRSTLPNTVCLLSSRETVEKIRTKNKNKEKTHLTRHCGDEKLRSVRARLSRICHADGSGPIVAKFGRKFVLEFSSPETLSSGAVAARVASLNHESANDAMKEKTLEKAASRKADEILISARSERGEETNANVAGRSVENTKRWGRTRRRRR